MIEIIREGGVILWIIMASGGFGLIVFFERGLHLHRARIRSEDFLKGICNNLQRSNVEEAVTICEETPGPVASIVKTAILHRTGSRASVQNAVNESGAAEIARMERRLVAVVTVAQVAPLLGLLGTILSMMNALIVMRGQGPLVQQSDMVVWLTQALISTAGGLTVAIICYPLYNLLLVKVERIVLDMEKAASEIVAFLKGIEPDKGGGQA